MDELVSRQFQGILTAQGMQFALLSKVIGGSVAKGNVQIEVEEQNQEKKSYTAEAALIAIGRRPFSHALGLEKVGVAKTEKGQVIIDNQFRTSQPSIYAIGDLVDGPMLAHKASEEGVAVAEIIAGHTPLVDYISIPNVIYTSPEVACVGLTEAEAKGLSQPVRTGIFYFKANSRAKCTGEEEGFVKIVAHEKSGHLLGVHILGPHASELIASCAVAIHKKMTALELASLPFAHPTLSEAIKEAALAVYKRALHS